ncbi:hypothetical protein MRX96_018770 [Rhipicephalus microplus]
MVTVDCAQELHRWHLDKLRHRAESVDSDRGRKQKQEPVEGTAKAVQESPKKTVTGSAFPTPPLLQRSSRPRKPPEHYGF